MSEAEGAASPEPGAWQDGAAAPELSAFAARLLRLRSHEGLGPRCERLRFPGEAVDRFAARRELGTTLAGRVARWECRERERDDLPERVTKGLRHNQKPFHLWNVERAEHDESLKFERVAGLIVGRAAALTEDQRPPRKLTKATRVLREWLEEQAFQRVMLAKDKQRNAKLLRDKLPYGRADDDPGESVVIQPGEAFDRSSPFVRLPEGLPSRATREPSGEAFAPPSFDFSQADEEDAPPPAGFDFSQPDEEDAPPPAGFDFSQPDDEGV